MTPELLHITQRRLGLNNRELAQALNTSLSTITKWRSGQVGIRRQVVMALQQLAQEHLGSSVLEPQEALIMCKDDARWALGDYMVRDEPFFTAHTHYLDVIKRSTGPILWRVYLFDADSEDWRGPGEFAARECYIVGGGVDISFELEEFAHAIASSVQHIWKPEECEVFTFFNTSKSPIFARTDIKALAQEYLDETKGVEGLYRPRAAARACLASGEEDAAKAARVTLALVDSLGGVPSTSLVHLEYSFHKALKGQNA